MSHYSNGYTIAIVRNGKIVETRLDSQVAIPFGGDYAIRLINTKDHRAVAKINVDGQNVSGAGFVVPAYGSVDIERPADKAVNFRFASVDSRAAEAHGKAGPDMDGTKGLILVEWRPEKVIRHYGTGYLGAEAIPCSYNPNPPSSLHSKKMMRGGSLERRVSTEKSVPTCGGIVLPDSGPTMMSFAPDYESRRELSSGVTIEGDVSSQRFTSVAMTIDYTVPVTVTTLKLMGYVEAEGIPVNGTAYCPACRTKTVKKTDKFCRSCGERFNE